MDQTVGSEDRENLVNEGSCKEVIARPTGVELVSFGTCIEEVGTAKKV